MQMTFRWFGKDLDTVSLEQIKQIPGVVGVVPAPVSYTHLDVYKRQELPKAFASLASP